MIFDNATILTMNPRREIISHGAVAISGERIVAVGKSNNVAARFPEKRRINCNGNVLLPGLVDTHVHTAQAMLRGCADDLNLLDWLFKRIWVLQGSYTEDDGRASASLCLLEMIKSGTTAFIECLLAEIYGFDGVAKTVVKSGMRAAIAKVVMDLPTYARSKSSMPAGMIEDGQTSLSNTISAHSKWNGAGNGRIQVWFGPRSPGGVTPELYDEIGRIARERGMGITIHLANIPADIDYARSQGFRSPIEFANAHGLLGPRSVFGHCILTDEADFALMAKTGSHVAHCPAANIKGGEGIAPVNSMLVAGVNVTLGCDGGPSNNTYDILRDLRLTAGLAKLRDAEPTVLPAETVLEIATINGARALGLEHEIGSIEVGKQADFIVINMDSPHLIPAWDPVSTLVYSAHGSDVDTVVIQGQVVMQGRKVNTLDEESIKHDIRQRYQQVAKRAGLEISPRWPVL